MTRVEELIRDYNRTFKKIGNSESWRAILLLYCALLVFCGTYLLSNYTTGAAHTWCKAISIAVLILFFCYCAGMAAVILSRGTMNRGKGEQKLVALLQLLEKYQIDWRDKDAVRKLIAESDRAKHRIRLDLTILPRLSGFVTLPCLMCLIRFIRSMPVPDLMLDILGKIVVALEILCAVLVVIGVFAFLEWVADRLAKQYRNQASRYGIFSQQIGQLLVFEQAYLEQLLQSAQKAPAGKKKPHSKSSAKAGSAV